MLYILTAQFLLVRKYNKYKRTCSIDSSKQYSLLPTTPFIQIAQSNLFQSMTCRICYKFLCSISPHSQFCYTWISQRRVDTQPMSLVEGSAEHLVTSAPPQTYYIFYLQSTPRNVLCTQHPFQKSAIITFLEIARKNSGDLPQVIFNFCQRNICCIYSRI